MNWDREMSKIIFLMIIAGLTIVVVAAININRVDARQQPEFLQISVLAEHQADYGVDEQVIAIPAVSVDIVEDAAQDLQMQSSVPVITYTSLPTKVPQRDREGNENSEAVDETRHDNGQGNGNGNQGNPGSRNSDQNNGNENNGNHGNGISGEKGNNKAEEKDKDKGNSGQGGKDKEKDKGNGGNSGNDNEESNENKPEKKK
jgi:hypothetical protein